MEHAHAAPKVRPYWHVDLKWICGILFTITLTGALLASALTVLTREDVAVPAGASVLKNVLLTFSGQGENQEGEEGNQEEELTDAQKAEKFRQDLLAKPGDVIQPIENQPATLTRAEIETLPAEELVDLMFFRLAQSYYQKGVEGVAAEQGLSEEEQEKAKNQASVLNLINQDTHELINRIRIWLMLVTLLPFIGLVYFSHGAGRLVSPGLVLFFVGLPGTVVTALIAYVPKDGREGGPIPYLSPELATEVGRSLFATFAAASISGAVLLLAAIVVGLIRRYQGKHVAEVKTAEK